MSLHFAHGRSELNNADWSIATTSGGNLETQNLYFSLQAANQAGKNLMIVSDVINITSGNKLTFTINSSALRTGEGWTHYVIGVSTSDDVTTFEQIAKIPIYGRDGYNNIDFDAPDVFPLTLEITEQEQLTTGLFVETLPTTNLVDGMIRGVDDPDNFIYEYDAVVDEWNKVSSFSNYILDVFYEGGCAVDLSSIDNFEYVKTPTYIPDGTNSAKIWYFLKNDSGFEIPAGTSIKMLVDVDGYDKSKLFDNKIFYTVKGFSLEDECLLRTTYIDSGQPLDFINFEQTHSAAFPTLNLKDRVRVGESVFIELYINVHEQEFAGQLAQGNISIIPQFVKSVATYNPVGSLFEKGIIYGTYGKKRVTPNVGLSATVREGSGIVKSYFFFQPESVLTGFANNTNNQEVYINRSGITYLDTQERDDTLLRAIVDTTAKESHVGEWSEYGSVAADSALYLTVSYPCDVDLVANVRSDYPDVLANDEVYFNVKKINIYVQRESDGEIRKFANRLVAAGDDQNFTLNDWSSGEVVGSVSTTKVSFFNPDEVSFTTISSVGDFAATNYRVTYSFVYEGDVISDISHSVALGCIKEAEKDLADVATSNGYATVQQVKDLTTVSNGDIVYVVETDRSYVYNASNEEDNDDVEVLEPTSGNGRWLDITRKKANEPYINIVAPTVDEDSSVGYQVGDKWLDTIEEKEYTLIDATVGAAVWKEVGISSYNDLTDTPTLGTAAALNVGTTANKVVQLNGDGKLPAVDGSLLTNLPGGGGGGGTTFADNVFRIQDNGDATKQIAFEASGITTGTTRTLTVPDVSGTLISTDTLTDKSLYYYDASSKLLKPIPIGTVDQVLVAKPSLDPPYQFATVSGGYGGREVLNADRTYYVRTDGSDSNNGLTNNAGGAFLTIQKAIDVAASLDISIFNVTIRIQAGTWTTPIILKSPVGSGTVTVRGNGNDQSTIISTTSNSCFSGKYSGNYKLEFLKLQTTTSGSCINCSGKLEIGNIDFGTAAESHIALSDASCIFEIVSNYSISGSAPYHIVSLRGGYFLCTGKTITITGTPNFAGQFLWVAYCAIALFYTNTFIGSATGQCYSATLNGVILTAGASLPGSITGTTATGGQYA